MKEIVERVVNTFSQKPPQIASELERKLHEGISDFVADLLSKHAGQLAKFGDREPRA
jgi:hypothetical protein